MNSSNKSQLVLSIGTIVLGALFICFPNQILNIIFFIIGGFIFVFGLFNLIANLKTHKGDLSGYKPIIALDVITIIIGIVFASLAWLFVYVFVIILGILFVILGIYSAYSAIVNPSLSTGNKVLNVIVSILEAAIGIMLFINISGTITWIMYVLGAILILIGILIAISYFETANHENTLLQKAKNKFKKFKEKKNKDVIDAVDVKEETIEEDK